MGSNTNSSGVKCSAKSVPDVGLDYVVSFMLASWGAP